MRASPTRLRRPGRWADRAGTVVLAFYILAVVFPLVWIMLMSLKTPLYISLRPPRFIFPATLDNYRVVTGLGRVTHDLPTSTVSFLAGYRNSVLICAGAVAVGLLLGVPAAYALSRFRFPLRQRLGAMLLSFRFGPEFAVLIPLYAIYQSTGLYDTRIGLVLAYQLMVLPLVVWIMKGYFNEIPVELEEAAQIDGASWWTCLVRVTLPLSAPGLAATAVLAFVLSWNNFTFGLVLGGTHSQPVTATMLGYITYYATLWGQMAAASVLAIAPQIILAVVVQRFIVKGLSFGALK